MDGPWQIGAKTAHEYGRAGMKPPSHAVGRPLYRTGRLRLVQSRNGDYARWEYEVLDHCFDHVDFISLHTYFMNPHDSTESFSAISSCSTSSSRSGGDSPTPVAATRRSPSASCSRSTSGTSGTRRARILICASLAGRTSAAIEEVYNTEDAPAGRRRAYHATQQCDR